MYKLTVLTLALMMVVLASCGEQKPQPIVEDGKAPYYANLDSARVAANEDQLIAIDFWTDWCYWCKVLDTAVFADPKGIEFFSKDMVLARINAEVDTVLAKKYHVTGYPTILLIDKNGEEIDRLVGFAPTDEFIQTLLDFSNGIGTLADLINQAETNDDRGLAYKIADKCKYSGRAEQAIEWYGKVVAAGDPKDSLSSESRISLADMYRRAKEYDRALDAFRGIQSEFKAGPVAQTAGIYIGLTYREMADTAKAIEAFEDWLQKYPDADDGETDYVKEKIEGLKNPPVEEE